MPTSELPQISTLVAARRCPHPVTGALAAQAAIHSPRREAADDRR